MVRDWYGEKREKRMTPGWAIWMRFFCMSGAYVVQTD
jgi:hypothetical protein